MSGERTRRVVPLNTERKNSGANYGHRISKLETDMSHVKSSLEIIRENTQQLVSLQTTVSGLAGYIKKYGKQSIVFGAGVFTTAGIGNPKVWTFIAQFFG